MHQQHGPAHPPAPRDMASAPQEAPKQGGPPWRILPRTNVATPAAPAPQPFRPTSAPQQHPSPPPLVPLTSTLPAEEPAKQAEWKTASEILRDMGLPAAIYPHRNPIGFLAGMNVMAMPFNVDIGLSIKGNIHYSKQFANLAGANGSINRGWRYNAKAEAVFREYYRKFPAVFTLIREGVTDQHTRDDPTVNANNYVVGLEHDIVLQIVEWIRSLKLPSIKTKGNRQLPQSATTTKTAPKEEARLSDEAQKPKPVETAKQGVVSVASAAPESKPPPSQETNETKQKPNPNPANSTSKRPASTKPPAQPQSNKKGAPQQSTVSEKKKLARISDFIDELLKEKRKQRKKQRKQELKAQQDALNPDKAKQKRDKKKKSKKKKTKETSEKKKGIQREGPRKHKLSKLKKIILHERELLAAQAQLAAANPQPDAVVPSAQSQEDSTVTSGPQIDSRPSVLRPQLSTPESQQHTEATDEDTSATDNESSDEQDGNPGSNSDSDNSEEEDGASSSSEDDSDSVMNDMLEFLSIDDVVGQLGLDLAESDDDNDANINPSSNNIAQAAEMSNALDSSQLGAEPAPPEESPQQHQQTINQAEATPELTQTMSQTTIAVATPPSPTQPNEPAPQGRRRRQQREKQPPPQPVRREYCTQEISPALNKVVLELLSKLWTFQTRLKKNEPQKYMAKKRYVLGLRQVMRGVVAGTIKTVIFAPNIEKISSPGGLDSIVNLIIRTCRESGINVVFALSMKRIGKATKSRVPISCVGIYSADGALDLYKRMLGLAEEGRGQYKNLQRQQARAAAKASSQAATNSPLESQHAASKSQVDKVE